MRFCPPLVRILANPVGWKIFAAEGLWHSSARRAWKAAGQEKFCSLQLNLLFVHLNFKSMKWVDSDQAGVLMWYFFWIQGNGGASHLVPQVLGLWKSALAADVSRVFPEVLRQNLCSKDVPHSSGFDLPLKLQLGMVWAFRNWGWGSDPSRTFLQTDEILIDLTWFNNIYMAPLISYRCASLNQSPDGFRSLALDVLMICL